MGKESLRKIKSSVPTSYPERFMARVWDDAEMYRMLEIPDIYHHIGLLEESIGRHLLKLNGKASPQKTENSDRKRFIVIFKNRYQQLMDLEYSRTVVGADIKMIDQAVKELIGKGFTIDEYLAWVFEDFLVDNSHFRPPTIKAICGQYVCHSFFDNNKEMREARERKETDKRAGLDLIGRTRVLLRSGLGENYVDLIKRTLKGYRDKEVTLLQFRKVVEEVEGVLGG